MTASGRGNGQQGGGGRGRGGPRERGSFKHLGRAIRYLGHYKRTAMIAYASLFLSTAAQLVVPQTVQNILDAVTNALTALEAGADPLQTRTVAETALLWAIGLTLLFAIIRGLFAFAQSYMAEKVSQEMAFDFRNDLFAKIQHLSFSYHDRNQTGQLMIRATDDVEKVRVFIGQGLLFALQAVVLLVGALVLLGITNWNLTLYVLPILPIALLLFMLFGAVSQPLFGKVQAKLSVLNTILQENLAGIKVVKAFAREEVEQRRFGSAADELMQQQITLARIFSFLFPFIFLIANLGQVVVIYFGGRQIIAETLTIGEWQKFSLYLLLAFFPIGQLGFIISQMSQASASATRIFEILDAKNEVTDKPNAQPLPPIQGQVVFQDVTFRYFSSSDPVLSEVSLEAKPGETIALLGATGSGKTTIINLVPRFYDVSAGKVLIDGHDVRDVQLESLRRQIGIVLQETNLFTGTIRDNIAFGRPEATDDEIIAAAKAAAAHDFITDFPQGYDTPVGERGATLSGGQKQRVAIARSLCMEPRIMLFDEPTSALDPEMVQEVLAVMQELARDGMTMVVVSHEVRFARKVASRVVLMADGEVVEVAPPQQFFTNPRHERSKQFLSQIS